MKRFDMLDNERLLAAKSAEIIRRFHEERQRFLLHKEKYKHYTKELSTLD